MIKHRFFILMVCASIASFFSPWLLVAVIINGSLLAYDMYLQTKAADHKSTKDAELEYLKKQVENIKATISIQKIGGR